MNTEELAQKQTPSDALHYDAHEFDGLRGGAEAYVDTWFERTDRFIHQNPWLCVAMAVGAGCALACWLSRRGESTVD